MARKEDQAGGGPDSTVVLDVDGTLVDSTYHHALAWHRGLDHLGQTVPLWRIHHAIGLGGDRIIPHLLGGDFEKEHGDEARELWHRAYDRLVYSTSALPGAAELLQELERRGVTMVMATSGDRKYTEHALHVLQAGELIDDVVTSDDVPSSKPAPDMLEAALESVGGSRAVVVGDSLWDVQSARRAGLPMVAVLTGGISRQELLDEGACQVYDEPVDVLEALDDVLALVPGAREG
ncbi:MAG: HAD family hydrolase [Marmoricola sp.]